MMQLSALSRTTSISYSFQPISDSSISSSLVGDRSRPALADLFELFRVVGDAAAGAAEREARADHHRETGCRRCRAVMRFCTASASSIECAMPLLAECRPDAGHRVLELEAVFGLLDCVFVGADHLDAVLLQHAVFVQVERAVQRRLAAHRRQHRVGLSLAMIFSTTCQVIGSM
jgi:hypothetical protein